MPLYNPPTALRRRLRLSGTTYQTLPGVVPTGTVGTSSLVAGRLFLQPIFLEQAVVCDQLSIEVTTLAASTHARVGIYSTDADWSALTLVSGSDAAEFDTSTTGVKSNSVSLALPAGPYFLALISDGAPTLRRVTAILPALTFMDTWSANLYITAFNISGLTYGALNGLGVTTSPTPTAANSPGITYFTFMRWN